MKESSWQNSEFWGQNSHEQNILHFIIFISPFHICTNTATDVFPSMPNPTFERGEHWETGNGSSPYCPRDVVSLMMVNNGLMILLALEQTT